MEKESADKATTEIENSVTSKEESSLAENESKEAVDIPAEVATATEETGDKANEEPVDLSEKSVPESPGNDLPKEAESGEEVIDTPEPKPEPEPDKLNPAEDQQKAPKGELEPEKGVESSTDHPKQEKSKDEGVDTPEPKLDKLDPVKGEQKEPKAEEDSEKKDEPKEATVEDPKSEQKPAAVAAEAEIEPKEAAKEETPESGDEFNDVDFTTYSKEELVEVVKKLGKTENPFKADKVLQKIAPLFNEIRSKDRKAALEKFVAEGGSEDDFQLVKDELELRFDANYKLIKDKKSKKFKEQDKERSKNLVQAEDILVELREFMDSEESNSSFNHFKTIQQKWKDLGEVPSQNSKTLWANYNALIHRFYDQRSIYFELKELDRKKNYEAKLELCAKAEALEQVENLREAIKTLNDLHHEFKHMGPVPQEVQEELWQRFKAASDKVYDKRKAFVSELKAELHENQEKKEALIQKIQPISEFDSDRIKEWNTKTKELLALQKEWDAVGGLPKEKAQEINRAFWRSFKKFFSNKHKFFKKLDAERDQNLVKKQELLEKALKLKDSDDWDKTANELKKIQNDWREVGPVPEKMRKKLFDDFKAACDEFFDNRRKGMKSSQDQYKDNLKAKKDIIKQIEALVKDADKNLDKFNDLRESFAAAGYVPRKNINSVKEDFQTAVANYLNELTVLNIKEKTEISLEAEFNDLAGGQHSESDLYHKEQSVRRQINKLEDDIALWQNNLEFFAQSKSTDKLRKEVNEKISSAQEKVDGLRRQLKMLRSL